MEIILLSGGSGKRMWPLSNDTRSKQFLKLLPTIDGGRESMVQRVVRQLNGSEIHASITVATSISQRDVIVNQLGNGVSVVTEPMRRDTFPAIALACSSLYYEKGCAADEVVVVMPCDQYTEQAYFEAIQRMADSVRNGVADLVLMGVRPSYPDTRYGYIVPTCHENGKDLYHVSRFIEKPDAALAEALITESAMWNAGVFAFRLGYVMDIVKKYSHYVTFAEIRSHYDDFPQNSFDYEVVETSDSVAVIPFDGFWKDLGTWHSLTEELSDTCIGNVIMDDDTADTHVINELEMPIMCIGAKNLVIAASNDGILVSDKSKSENIKTYADCLMRRPMYEERRWGEYKVIDMIGFADGYKALTKQLLIRAGKNISYQVHHHRDEVWTFIEGEGRLILDGVETKVERGITVTIKKGTMHAVKAVTDLRFIEVQSGDELIEEDIERFDWEW